jgi:hypothetical protein
MRPVEANRQKEGLAVALEPLEQPYRFRRRNAIGVVGISSVVGKPAYGGAELSRPQRKDPVVNLTVPAPGVDGEIPRQVIVQPARANLQRHTIVIQLSHTRREPPVGAKQLRQRDCIGQFLAKVRGVRCLQRSRVGEDAGRIRPSAGEQRRSAWAAQRILTVGAVEPDATGRQFVDVRRSNRRSVRAEVVVQIVGNQKEHVGTSRRLGFRAGCPSHGQQSGNTGDPFQRHTSLAAKVRSIHGYARRDDGWFRNKFSDLPHPSAERWRVIRRWFL